MSQLFPSIKPWEMEHLTPSELDSMLRGVTAQAKAARRRG